MRKRQLWHTERRIVQLMVVRRGTAEERRVCQPSCALAS